jgi:hypothetical protein
VLEQDLLVQPVSFTGQPFDPVSVHRSFEVAAADPKACLQRKRRFTPVRRIILQHIKHPKGKDIDTLTVPEYPFDPLAALEPLIFAQCKTLVDGPFF